MKKKLAVISGGTNTEHAVSLISARSVIKNLDKSKYTITKITIRKNGSWTMNNKTSLTPPKWSNFDIIFPLLHGPYGEDGTIQGMLEMADVPYVGSGVLASALCMDKVMQKDLCRFYNIKTPRYFWFVKNNWTNNRQKLLDHINAELDYPLFVKPTRQGSSVGITKIKSKSKLTKAITRALEFDHKIIIEEAIPNAREIECSILGNESPKTSVLGEIISSNEFYDYSAKYIDGKTKDIIPAKLPKNLSDKISKSALKAYQVLGCAGLARVDFLLNSNTNEFFLNELNTMPGFTSISMYPKLWEATGLGYSDLLDQLIQLGIDHHYNQAKINLSHTSKKKLT